MHNSKREGKSLAKVCACLVVCCFVACAQTSRAQSNELDQVRASLQTAHWQDAEKQIEHYLELHGDSAEGLALQGLVLYRQHQPRASMAAYLHASELGTLTAFDLRIFAMDCAAVADMQEAERWLNRSLEQDDQAPATWEALGHVRYAQQKYLAAIEALKRALSLAPRTISAEALIGLAFEHLPDAEKAEEAYRTAISWQTADTLQDAVPYIGLGRVLLAEDRSAEAIAPLESVVRSTSVTVEAHELLGQAYLRQQRGVESVREFEMAINMDHKSARLHLLLARAYRAMGQIAQAEAEQQQYSAMKTTEVQR